MLVASSHTLRYTETNNVSIMSFKTTNPPSLFYRFLGSTDSLECYLFVTVLRQSHCPGYKNVRDHHLPPFPLCKHDFPAKLVKFPCWWDRESVFGPLRRVSQLSWTMVTSAHNVWSHRPGQHHPRVFRQLTNWIRPSFSWVIIPHSSH